MLDNSLPSHAIIPWHRSLWPNGSSPWEALSLLAEQTLRHKGSEPCTSLILSACFPPRKKEQEPGSKVGRLLPPPPLPVSWKSLLKFGVGCGAGCSRTWVYELTFTGAFIHPSKFPLSIHQPYIKYMPSQTQQAIRHIDKKARWDVFFLRSGFLPLA